MHDVMRKRILRKLEQLPEEQLYQLLDYLDFLEAKYTETATRPSTGFQRFAERLEDRMRARSVAARAMTGTMKVVSTAGKVVDGLAGALESAARASGITTPADASRVAAPPALPRGSQATPSASPAPPQAAPPEAEPNGAAGIPAGP